MTDRADVPIEHQLELVTPDRWVQRAADLLASAIRQAVEDRGHCAFALSGGGTPAPVFAELAGRALPWSDVTLVQVDERIAPLDSGQRNLVQQRASFEHIDAAWLPLPIGHDVPDSMAGVDAFVTELSAVTGPSLSIDVVHLGLGADGHTASLVPGDPVIDEVEAPVVATAEPYQGTYRLTLTRAVLERAVSTIWLVRGDDKRTALRQLLDGDVAIPAAHLRLGSSTIVTDVEPITLSR